MVPTNESRYSTRQVYLRLLRNVIPLWRIFAVGIVGMLVLAATEPAIPAILKPTLDGSFVEKDTQAVTLLAGLLVLVFFLRGLAGFVSAVALSWVATKLVMGLRSQMFDKLMTLPTAFYDRHPSGTLISKVTYDASQVTEAATNVFTILVRDTCAIIGLLAWMLYLDWRLTLVALVAAPLVVLVVRRFSRRLRRMSTRVQTTIGEITGITDEAVGGHKVLRTFGAQDYEKKRFFGTINQARLYQMKFQVASAANAPIAQLVTAISLAIIIYLAAHKSAAGTLSIGSFVSFLTAMGMLFSPLKRLTGVNGRLQKGIAAAQSVFGLIDQRSEHDHGTRVIERAAGALELRGVSFSYEEGAVPAVYDVDLKIEPGEAIALVGPSGGGKSTIASLILRFYDVNAGNIFLDGIETRDLTLASLRRNISIVTQDVVLFNDTVAANIAYGRGADCDQGAVIDAARAAYALEFIERMPQGFDTVIGERGIKLSGGQRQRIALARAFLKDASVLILDEATSSLDSASERCVQAAIEELRKHRTTLVIAHRLSTIERADRVVVLAEGRVNGVGTHEELLRNDSLYSGLYHFHFFSEPEHASEAARR